MVCMHNLAKQLPLEGDLLDLGTNASKAAMSIASGIADHKGDARSIFCVDPVFDLTNREAWAHSLQGSPENCPWWYVAESDFNAKVASRICEISSNCVNPILCGDYSTNAIPKYGPYAWVFIDSNDHEESLVRAELEILKSRMLVGGIIGFHDYGNYPAVGRVMWEFLERNPYEEVIIPWDSIREWVAANGGEEGNSSWHCLQEAFPCHVAAIRRVR